MSRLKNAAPGAGSLAPVRGPLPDEPEQVLGILRSLAAKKLWLENIAKSMRQYTTPSAIRRRKRVERFTESLVKLLGEFKYPLPDYTTHWAKMREAKLALEKKRLDEEITALAAWFQGKGPRPPQVRLTSKIKAGLRERGVKLDEVTFQSVRRLVTEDGQVKANGVHTVENLERWAKSNYSENLGKANLKMELAFRDAQLAWLAGKAPMPDRNKIYRKFEREINAARRKDRRAYKL